MTAYLDKVWQRLRPIVIGAIGLGAAIGATPAAAGVQCYGEALVGGSIGTNKISSGGASVTVATDGYTAGVGAGCDFVHGKWLVGGLGRASLAHITGTVGFDAIKSDAVYMAGVRAGYVPAGETLVYLLAGYQWQGLKIPALGTLDGSGFVYGAGLEFPLAPHVRLGLEVDRVGLGSFSDGGSSIKPTATEVMLTLKFNIGSIAEAAK